MPSTSWTLEKGKTTKDALFFLPHYKNTIQIRKKPSLEPEQIDYKVALFKALFDACLSCASGISPGNNILKILGSKSSQIMIDWHRQQIPGVFVDYGRAVHELTGEAFRERCRNLLKTLIAAIRVNGHAGAAPQQELVDLLERFDVNAGLHELIKREMSGPITARRIAMNSNSPVESAELYLLTLLIVDAENVQQNMYLFLLAEELLLSETVIYQLEHQASLLLTLESLYENFEIKAGNQAFW